VLTSTLARIADESRAQGLTNPAVILIGDVVTLREEIRWFDTQPLFGKRLLLPRPKQQAQASARAIRERAAEPVVFPVIEIVEPPDPERLRRAASELGSYDWVLFTSANGVERLFAALDALGLDARAFGRAGVGVIGPKTAEALRQRGVRADVLAEEFVGEGLAEAVLARGVGRRVLLARALEARDTLPDLLRRAGAEVDVVAAYQTVPVGSEQGRILEDLIEGGKLDVVLFTSSSTVDSVVRLLGARAGELLSRVTLASIGPITSRTLSVHGLHAAVTAERYTVEGLLNALEHHYEPIS